MRRRLPAGFDSIAQSIAGIALDNSLPGHEKLFRVLPEDDLPRESGGRRLGVPGDHLHREEAGFLELRPALQAAVCRPSLGLVPALGLVPVLAPVLVLGPDQSLGNPVTSFPPLQ